jgi:hypothetical protein
MSSLTLPKSGGLVNGELIERPMLALPTAESASSSLLATPTTMEHLPAREGEAYESAKNSGGRKNRQATGNLREQVIHSLPTPTARDHKEQTLGWTWQRDGVTQEDTLPRALTQLLPTPKATSNESQQNLAKYGPNLGMALMPDQYDWSGIVGRLLPTPTTDMGRQSGECRDFGGDMLHALTCLDCPK